MQQSGSRATQVARPTTRNEPSMAFLYKPLDFILVRSTLLPIESYLALSDATGPLAGEGESLVPRDPRIQWALAVGSSVLWNDLKRFSPSSKDASRLKGKLLRFLIRMSTRPTPYGLFAGVALGRWGPQTDLALAAEKPYIRTRPDMAWLLTFVQTLESRLDVRKHLRFVTNATTFYHGERVYISDRSPLKEGNVRQAVSVRATGVVKRALALAREPIFYHDLVEALLLTTSGATSEKVERLITELWQQALLLTDLRPPITTESPANYVKERLIDIPTAQEELSQLEAILGAAAIHDMVPPEEGVEVYQRLLTMTGEADKAAVQTDMALVLRGRHIAQVVGAEVAYAAELLLRMTVWPNGQPSLQAYRRAFVSRYGSNREVPILELLDPSFGLGPSAAYSNGSSDIAPARATRRLQTLLYLACSALQSHRQVVELDAETLACLETWTPGRDTAPLSLDLNVFIASTSARALDAGDFQIIVGPNLGAQAAGKNLGRFADLLGPEAQGALRKTAHAEARRVPDRLLVEMVYLPHKPRLANVTIRPVVRSHEIAIGISPGVSPEYTIPLDELVVGVRNNRFYVRWLKENVDIVICNGHMLNDTMAPGICRFLTEVSKEGRALMSSFDWGPASSFPFLPRVQVGRVVLRQAQWRIDAFMRLGVLPADSATAFREALERWRSQWQVPRYVYMSTGDNRLLLDLEDLKQSEELRTEVRHLRDGAHFVLQEVLPGLDQLWLEGPEGHYMSEMVMSLMLVEQDSRKDRKIAAHSGSFSPQPGSQSFGSISTVLPTERLRPPGSDWLFIKLYCPGMHEEDVIANPLRTFAAKVVADGLVRQWFYMRYADPDRHIRFRLCGEPSHLVSQVVPQLCSWATALMAEGLCSHFVFDTYDREVERYGGTAGIEVAEAVFAIDSCTVSNLIYLLQEQTIQMDRTALAVLSVDQLLADLGLTEAARLQWLSKQVISRHEVGSEYRQRKTLLRSLLGDPHYLPRECGGTSLLQTLATQRTTIAAPAGCLRELIKQGELTQTPEALYASFIHMHCNRLFGIDRSAEQRTLGLLLRTRESLEQSSPG